MSNNEQLAGGESHRTFRCTFGPVREKDLVWPPPDDDLDACAVVPLDARSEGTGDVASPAAKTDTAANVSTPIADGPDAYQGAAPTVAATPVTPTAAAPAVAAPVGPKPAALGGVTPIPKIAAIRPAKTIKPTFGDCRAPGRAPRVRPLVVPMVPAPSRPEAASSDAAPVVDGALHGAMAHERGVDHAIGPELPPVLSNTAPHAHRHEAVPAEVVAAEAADPEGVGASRSAWLATFAAAACLAVAVFEYREIFSPVADTRVAMAEAPPMPTDIAAAELAPTAVRELPSAAPKAAPAPAADLGAPMPAREIRPTPTSQTPPPTTKPAPPVARVPVATAVETRAAAERPAAPVVEPRPTPPLRPIPAPVVAVRGEALPPVAAPASTTPAAAAATPAARPPVTTQAPEPALAVRPPAVAPGPTAMAAARTPVPAPSPTPEPAVLDTAAARPTPAVVTAVMNGDEDDIRSTLTRFRTAYSQLNARAARDVWPSVDARALERAFHSLKSQELRFESCNLKVTGERAQAACKGRAVYVPRIGDQSPRLAEREWTFELRKADERWTIASARTL